MKQIKFRAWDKIRKRMVNSGLSFDYENYYSGNININNAYDERERQIEDLELMQFTGLKDKNEKEIYEGDIVKTIFGCFYEVDWSETFASFQLIKIVADTYWKFRDNSDLEPKTMEVIGNIYENPELLKTDAKEGAE